MLSCQRVFAQNWSWLLLFCVTCPLVAQNPRLMAIQFWSQFCQMSFEPVIPPMTMTWFLDIFLVEILFDQHLCYLNPKRRHTINPICLIQYFSWTSPMTSKTPMKATGFLVTLLEPGRWASCCMMRCRTSWVWRQSQHPGWQFSQEIHWTWWICRDVFGGWCFLEQIQVLIWWGWIGSDSYGKLNLLEPLQ